MLGRGRGAGDLDGQGQGGLWLRQKRAGGRGGGWVAEVVVERGGAGCVSCCVCFLRRVGRCPCCADRRRGCPVLGQGCLARCCARHGFWTRQCSSGIPQVQFLEKVVDVPVECNVSCLSRQCRKTVEVLQLTLIDKVDDVPVVQVVVRVSEQWRCLRFSSSPESWTFSSQQRRVLSAGLWRR